MQYEAAGAVVSEDLSEADIMVGVKQVHAHELQRDKTYLFFSHVIKGQVRASFRSRSDRRRRYPRVGIAVVGACEWL